MIPLILYSVQPSVNAYLMDLDSTLVQREDTSEYMIIRKGKIVKHGVLRLPEDGDCTEQIKVLNC